VEGERGREREEERERERERGCDLLQYFLIFQMILIEKWDDC
jgi:hypothetical protein